MPKLRAEFRVVLTGTYSIDAQRYPEEASIEEICQIEKENIADNLDFLAEIVSECGEYEVELAVVEDE